MVGIKKGKDAGTAPTVGLASLSGNCPYAQARPDNSCRGIAQVSDKIYTRENLL